MAFSSHTGRLLVVIYVAWMAGAAIAFVNAHGGISGDFEEPSTRLDYHPRSRYAACVVFNRWETCGQDDPYVSELFTTVHIPALIVGQLVFKAVSLIPVFSGSFPLGLSYPSYVLVLTALAGIFQWYAIGVIIEWAYRRSGRRSATENE